MKKFVVETYYTCTFKTIHSLDDLNETELSKIDNRSDGEVEVIDVKLNNRKTKKLGDKKTTKSNKNDLGTSVTENISSKILAKSENQVRWIPFWYLYNKRRVLPLPGLVSCK